MVLACRRTIQLCYWGEKRPYLHSLLLETTEILQMLTYTSSIQYEVAIQLYKTGAFNRGQSQTEKMRVDYFGTKKADYISEPSTTK